MGEAKRRKLLDPNYGKIKHISKVAFFPLFFSKLDIDLAKEIQEKVAFCESKSYKPIFMVRRINAKFYSDAMASIARSWFLANGISQEVLENIFFPLDDKNEEQILTVFLESITRKQHKKPSVVMFVNNDVVDQDCITSLNEALK